MNPFTQSIQMVEAGKCTSVWFLCIAHAFGCEPVTKEGRRSPYDLHAFNIYRPVSFMYCNDLGPLTNLVVPWSIFPFFHGVPSTISQSIEKAKLQTFVAILLSHLWEWTSDKGIYRSNKVEATFTRYIYNVSRNLLDMRLMVHIWWNREGHLYHHGFFEEKHVSLPLYQFLCLCPTSSWTE